MDIGERKSLEEQVRQGHKMEAIGQLAGGVAHDFNNLLTVIHGYADLVLATMTTDDPRRGDVDEIVKAAARAAGLTRQLLAFSRKQVLQPALVDVNTLVANTCGMLRRLIGEDVELVTNLARDLDSVYADAGQLEQILMNLAINARDAMPHGGRLSIETAAVAVDDSSAMGHTDVKPGSYVMLAVADSGTGMDEQTQERIFEPFFTTKERGRGTGLGLATVYGIVRQSGGYISVETKPGCGATFKVFLPRAGAPAVGDIPLAGVEPAPTGSETLLLVEDEEAVRFLSRTLLERAGYHVLDAADPHQAEDLFRQHADAIDLLVTDVVMPGSSGPSLFARLSAERPSLKVLYMSGYPDESMVYPSTLLPKVEFLQKPFTAEALMCKVREALDG
jgi:nitrogen-specific signal transduction histidine kinase/CheY-like chemotaxis protein